VHGRRLPLHQWPGKSSFLTTIHHFADMLVKLLHNLGREATISADALVDALDLAEDDVVF
jgi:hypothetical protein